MTGCQEPDRTLIVGARTRRCCRSFARKILYSAVQPNLTPESVGTGKQTSRRFRSEEQSSWLSALSTNWNSRVDFRLMNPLAGEWVPAIAATRHSLHP